jgi:hypothetical protein
MEIFTVATCEKQDVAKEVPLPGKSGRTVTAFVEGLVVELLPTEGLDHGTFTMRFLPDTPEEFDELVIKYKVGTKIGFNPEVVEETKTE